MQFTFFSKPKPLAAPEVKTIQAPGQLNADEAQLIAGNPDAYSLEEIIQLIEYIDGDNDDEWCDSADAMRIRSYCCQIAAAREHRLTGTIQQAQRHEECAELIYSNLPAHLRW